jgi:hypothetical protein
MPVSMDIEKDEERANATDVKCKRTVKPPDMIDFDLAEFRRC